MTVQSLSKTPFTSSELFFRSALGAHYIWDNLIIEKRISVGWVYKLYKGSLLEAMWLVLSSPVK